LAKVPVLNNLDFYIEHKTFPGGTFRNFDSYGHKISPLTEEQKVVLCDPQTSGGLLVAVDPAHRDKFHEVTARYGMQLESFGVLTEPKEFVVEVK
jgi:selenide,water dikinase